MDQRGPQKHQFFYVLINKKWNSERSFGAVLVLVSSSGAMCSMYKSRKAGTLYQYYGSTMFSNIIERSLSTRVESTIQRTTG